MRTEIFRCTIFLNIGGPYRSVNYRVNPPPSRLTVTHSPFDNCKNWSMVLMTIYRLRKPRLWQSSFDRNPWNTGEIAIFVTGFRSLVEAGSFTIGSFVTNGMMKRFYLDALIWWSISFGGLSRLSYTSETLSCQNYGCLSSTNCAKKADG